MRVLRFALIFCLLLCVDNLSASIFGSVQGLIHDPQHRPVKGAQVAIHSVSSGWRQNVISDDAGGFHFEAVPVGDYMVMVDASGFAPQQQNVSIISDHEVKLHYALTIASGKETVTVTDVGFTVRLKLLALAAALTCALSD